MRALSSRTPQTSLPFAKSAGPTYRQVPSRPEWRSLTRSPTWIAARNLCSVALSDSSTWREEGGGGGGGGAGGGRRRWRWRTWMRWRRLRWRRLDAVKVEQGGGGEGCGLEYLLVAGRRVVRLRLVANAHPRRLRTGASSAAATRSRPPATAAAPARLVGRHHLVLAAAERTAGRPLAELLKNSLPARQVNSGQDFARRANSQLPPDVPVGRFS